MSDFDRDMDQDVDSLEREVNEKRAKLERSVDAVEKQLSPSRLVDQTMGYLREYGGDMTQSIGRSVKENPFPLVLTGVGLAWLMASQPSNRSAQSDRHAMGQQIQSMKQGADETVEQWQERTEATLNDLQQSAFDTGRNMQAQGKEVGDWFQEQPLVTGALGIAVGALAGSLIPSTRVENRLVGETADSVKTKVAKDITSNASDLSEQVEDVAGQLGTKVKNQADELINESTAV